MGKLVRGELMELSLDGEVFRAEAMVLDELNRHRIEEEKIFKLLRNMCDNVELDDLFERCERAEEDVKQQPAIAGSFGGTVFNAASPEYRAAGHKSSQGCCFFGCA